MLQYALPPQARFHIESPGRHDQVPRISIQRLLGGMVAVRALRDLSGSDLAAARADADLQFALCIKNAFPELRVEYWRRLTVIGTVSLTLTRDP